MACKHISGCRVFGILFPPNSLFFGTSAAAPHVAAIAALLHSLNPSLTWQQVKDVLTSAATKVSGMGGQNFTYGYGWGRVDAYQGTLLCSANSNKSASSQGNSLQRPAEALQRVIREAARGLCQRVDNRGRDLLCNSTDNGTSWGNTKLLSDGTATSLAPCITVGPGRPSSLSGSRRMDRTTMSRSLAVRTGGPAGAQSSQYSRISPMPAQGPCLPFPIT